MTACFQDRFDYDIAKVPTVVIGTYEHAYIQSSIRALANPPIATAIQGGIKTRAAPG